MIVIRPMENYNSRGTFWTWIVKRDGKPIKEFDTKEEAEEYVKNLNFD